MTAIIITGRKRGGPRQLAQYLQAAGKNESTRLLQVRGFVAKNIPDALLEMFAIADGCKSKDFLYHASINPRPGVKLSTKQWQHAVDIFEKNLGFVGHQRVVVEHILRGREHKHVVWNRVNPNTGRVPKLSFDRRACRNTALQLGQEFGLEPTPNIGKSFKRGELIQGRRTGIDPREVMAEVTAIWNKSKSGKEFASGLARKGYILAKGDRNQFVLVDRKGSIHGLRRRIQGATAKIIRRGLADIDPKTLPTIAEAKAQARAVIRADRGLNRGAKVSRRVTPAHAYASLKLAPAAIHLSKALHSPDRDTGESRRQPLQPVSRQPEMELSEPATFTPLKPQTSLDAMWEEYFYYEARGELNLWRHRWRAFLSRPRPRLPGPSLG